MSMTVIGHSLQASGGLGAGLGARGIQSCRGNLREPSGVLQRHGRDAVTFLPASLWLELCAIRAAGIVRRPPTT